MKKITTLTQTRARRRRKEARPSEILDAGFEAFAEKGFLGTSMDDVAVRAGVAKGTVYLYFESKEALFAAAVRARIVPLIGEIGSLVDGFEGTSAELLRAILTVFYGKIADPDARLLLRIMIGEGHLFPALITFYHREVLSKAIALMTRVIERGIARSEFNRNAATDMPLIIMAPAVVAAIWQLTFAAVQPVSLDQFIEAHLTLLTEGLCKPAPAV